MPPTHTTPLQLTLNQHQTQIQAQPLSPNRNTEAHYQTFSILEPRFEMYINPTLDPQAQYQNQTIQPHGPNLKSIQLPARLNKNAPTHLNLKF